MSPDAQALVASRYPDLLRAASFFGFNIADPGWTYRQSVSNLLRKHIILTYTHADPARAASHFVAVVPSDTGELVQIVPAFAHGFRLFDPGWRTKGTYAVFNRLIRDEQGAHPITQGSEWIGYAALYVDLLGGVPSIPTETDSIKATWDLTVQRATTPVIIIAKNGGATIAVSDLSEKSRTIRWDLVFDRRGQLLKAAREELRPSKVRPISMAATPGAQPASAGNALNP